MIRSAHVLHSHLYSGINYRAVQTRVAELEERVEKQREVLTETENQWHGQVEALEQRDRISIQVRIRKRM